LITRLCLASLLIAVPAGTGIFLLTQPAEKAVTDSTPAAEASAPSPTPNTTTTPAVSGPTAVSTAVVSAPATSADKPEPKAATASGVPTPGATSIIATPSPSNPPVGWGFSASEIAALLERGNALFRTGDVVSARLFYERAAQAGEARGAVRLGETFDPVFLNSAYLRGVRGDLDAAWSWYRRARELGATEVDPRLNALEAKEGRGLP